jgi:hypothetical protein
MCEFMLWFWEVFVLQLVEIATKGALSVYFESYFEQVEFGFYCHFIET